MGPPLSPETTHLLKNRDDLTRRLKLGGSQEDLDQLKALSKAIKYKVRKDKREAWKGELDIDSTPRNAWKVARKALGIQSSTTPKSLVNGQGETVSNPLLIAEVLANHFSSKVNTLRQARRTVPVQDPRDRLREYLKERFPSSKHDQGAEGQCVEGEVGARFPSGQGPVTAVPDGPAAVPEGPTADHPAVPADPNKALLRVPTSTLQEISLGKLKSLLTRFKGGKALGGDGLGANLLKLAAQTNLPALLHIVNLSIREGRFASRWKFHLVLPDHKKGDRQLPDNYRPVCHLVEVGRVVELVVWD